MNVTAALASAATIILALGAGEDLMDASAPSDEPPPFQFEAERLPANPIIHREMRGLFGEAGGNINGPSLIRVPDWIAAPLGRYYLYFAHHSGKYIRLAYADALEGPWKIHEGGVLHVADTPGYEGRGVDHIASPDVHVDDATRQIRMYFHQVPPTGGPPGQATYAAVSADGLRFTAREEYLGLFYFRVFEHDGWRYALAKYHNEGGVLYRSRDGLTNFEEGRRVLPRMRHAAVWKRDGDLYVFYSRAGDAPEHIIVSRVENLNDDWGAWEFSTPVPVLRPELDFEGVNEPIEPSDWGGAGGFVHQLRDPAIYEEDGRVFLLYSAGGERSIAIAELFLDTADE